MSDKTTKTVIVIGAGASKEFGLPVGEELQRQIARECKFDISSNDVRPFSHNVSFLECLPSAVGMKSYTHNDLVRLAKKANQLAKGVVHAASIDNFLHGQRTDQEMVRIGKLAIARCILKAEAESSISYTNRSDDFSNFKTKTELEPQATWLGVLTKFLTAGRDFDDFCMALKTVKFVCFNYDRCIERYLLKASSLIFPESQFDEELLSNSIQIIHPYGSLCDLELGSSRNASFGKIDDARLVLDATDQIKTFTEGMDTEVQFQIGDAFSLAETAVFLGYGFISTNDDFLFREAPFGIKNVFGTVLGVSDERQGFIENKLNNNCLMRKTPHDGWQQRGQPYLRPESCSALMHRFSHVLDEIGRS